MVDDKLVLELKSTERLPVDATQQLFGYLCGTNLQVGLLLHFGKQPRFYRVVYENRFKHRRDGNQ